MIFFFPFEYSEEINTTKHTSKRKAELFSEFRKQKTLRIDKRKV